MATVTTRSLGSSEQGSDSAPTELLVHPERSDEGPRLLIGLAAYRLSLVDDYANDADIGKLGHRNPRLDVWIGRDLVRGSADNTLCVPREVLARGLTLK